jgi:hypothetical protein
MLILSASQNPVSGAVTYEAETNETPASNSRMLDIHTGGARMQLATTAKAVKKMVGFIFVQIVFWSARI